MRPLFVKGDNEILRTLKKYIDSDETTILIEALVIEHAEKRSFLVLVGRREDGLVVRIYPGSEIEKTSGVKRVLAGTAAQILRTHPNLKVGKTNLQEFLDSSLG